MYEKFYNLFYQINRVFRRTLIRFSWNPRPSSYPYITGDGFRNFANHIYDDANPVINTHGIKEGDVVFVGNSRIRKFFSEIHPLINNRYILISHNGDEKIDGEVAKYIDGKIIKWYGINVVTEHPNVVPLPLGIENLHYYVNGIPSIFNSVRRKVVQKNNSVFYAFTVETNPGKRGPALEYLKNNVYAETLVKWLNFKHYLALLSTYKFTASPEGSSVEGHRTWDALYVGVVPIVTRSATTSYFEKIGIPMWVIDEWDELDAFNDAKLSEQYNLLMQNFDESKLFIDYWLNKIRNHTD